MIDFIRSTTLILVLSITLTGCAYLDAHRASMGHDSTFTYTQIGRVEFYGPMPLQLMQQNHAWFLTPEDAAIAQDSTQPVIQQPIVARPGTVLYPPLQPGQLRVVRIAHNIQGFTTQEPAPQWTGNVIHVETIVPWSGSESARYANEWRWQEGQLKVSSDRQPQTRTYNDGADAWGHK